MRNSGIHSLKGFKQVSSATEDLTPYFDSSPSWAFSSFLFNLPPTHLFRGGEMSKTNKKSSKKLAEELYDAHDGIFDPSDPIDKSRSSNKQSSSSQKPRNPTQATKKQSRPAQKKEDYYDPTGHEGGYDPSDPK